MLTEQRSETILRELVARGVELVVVGGMAAVMQGAPVITEDLDIVHRRTEPNVDRLLAWLLEHRAYHRLDLANRKLPPARDALLGSGHLNLATDLGKVDFLCELELGQGYDEILSDAISFPSGVRVLGLRRLIEVKARANRPKDRAVLPVLIATLDEQNAAKKS